MRRRGFQIVLFVAIALGIAALFLFRPAAERAGPNRSAPAKSPAVVSPTPSVAPVTATPENESRLADELNAPVGTIQRDLSMLEEIFGTWQTNFPRTGNPVGENVEITASLTGENALKFAFIPRRHRAVNSAGELCDRWGTPFRFHQLSGTKMEIRSAGPDRKFGTADDAILAPPQ